MERLNFIQNGFFRKNLNLVNAQGMSCRFKSRSPARRHRGRSGHVQPSLTGLIVGRSASLLVEVL